MMENADVAFKGRQFLEELREIAAEKDLRPGGFIPGQYQDALVELSVAANSLADEQLLAVSRFVPDLQRQIDSHPEMAESYTKSFSVIARTMGALAIRATKHGDMRFVEVLDDVEIQASVLGQLDRDYRRALWEVSGHDIHEISATDLSSRFVVYANPSEVNALQEEFFEVGNYYVKHAIANVSRSAREALTNATRVIKELSEDPNYADFSHNDIKRAAFRSPNDPKGFLDTALAKINELCDVPAYSALGPSFIKDAVFMRPANPKAFLDKAAEQFESLLADEAYAAFSSTLVRRAVLGYSSNPRTFLESCRQQISGLLENPDYAALGKGVVTHAVAYYPKEPAKFLDATRQKITTLSKNSNYLELGKAYIKNAVIKNPDDPETHLNQAVDVVNELMQQPRYQSFGRANIVQLVTHNTLDPAEKVRRVLNTYEQILGEEDYGSIPMYTLKHAVVAYANPREYLNKVLLPRQNTDL